MINVNWFIMLHFSQELFKASNVLLLKSKNIIQCMMGGEGTTELSRTAFVSKYSVKYF
jgi:hypothetical protein